MFDIYSSFIEKKSNKDNFSLDVLKIKIFFQLNWKSKFFVKDWIKTLH